MLPSLFHLPLQFEGGLESTPKLGLPVGTQLWKKKRPVIPENLPLRLTHLHLYPFSVSQLCTVLYNHRQKSHIYSSHTGASMNHARSIGTATVSDVHQNLWIFTVHSSYSRSPGCYFVYSLLPYLNQKNLRRAPKAYTISSSSSFNFFIFLHVDP